MDKREHTLAPQWLKSNGSTGGGGNAVQNTASSTLHSDDHAATLPSRSRLHMSNGDHDSYRSSSFMDRTSSSYSRRNNNCNGSMMHDKDSSGHLRSYSSFERNNRDRYREKNFRDYRDKERSVIGDYRDRDYTDHLSSDLLINRSEKDKLRRSQSLISGKQAEVWPKRAAMDSSCSSNSNNSLSHHNNLGVGASIVGSTHKVISERDFPSLGTVEKQGASDAERVSTGLNTAVQMLPISTTAAIGGIGWTSALAEVPTLKESNSAGPLSVQQTAPAMSATVAPIITTGLNMAETLAQAPSRARTAPQISVENQRLEELAIKQSRQLIPKTLVLNAEKLKPKAAIRNEISTTSKNGNQQISSHLVNLSPRGGPVRSDVKTLHGGKLLVLKGPLEKNGNSLASATNDLLSSTNHCKLLTNIPSIASATSARPRSPNIQKLTVVERKPYLPGTNSSSADKKPIVSQTQSRNDFFDLVRKKTSTPASSSPADPNSISCSSELIIEVVNTPSGPSSDGDVHDVSQHHLAPIEFVYSDEKEVVNAPSGPSSDGDVHDEPHHHLAPIGFVYSDEKEVEKEVAFLRLLGWNETEEETITAEEIDDFNKRYTEFRSSVKQCRDPELQQEKLRVVMLKSRASSLDNTSSECSSSDSDSDDSDV